MEQVFRIEIPVEVIDKTDAASLQRLETALQKISTGMKQNKAAATEAFGAIDRAAADAATSMDKVGSANAKAADSYDDVGSAASEAGSEQSAAASEAEGANSDLEDSVSDVGDAYDDTASAATEAGRKTDTAFDSASNSADKFSKRVEKTNQTLRSMFKEKLKLIIEALDKASPVLKSIWNSAKGLVSKTWSVAVRMKDLITAPFRKLYSWISSPITIAMSIAGVGLSANDLVTTYNDFETGMSGVRALTGATNEEFTLLKETAKELGADTSFSASEAAVGMQNLASAGFTTNEIVSAMPGMLDLAASSGTDLATASDIAATTLRGFALEASEATHVADVLAEAAARTNAEVADTGEAMKYIAPVAHAMGLSLEEVAASVGILSDAGIKGSQAGTTLRSALSRLAKPTSDMQEVMNKLGLSFYDSNGQMKSISGIVGMLKTQMAGLTAEQQQNALVTLFGQEAMSGMMVLLEAGPEKLDELTRSLEQCEGTASEMANVRLDNLAGDIEEMGGALETAKLEIMDKLNPYLREGVQWLTTKIPVIQEKIEQLIDAGIAKGKRLKDFLTGVFSSADFQNADGLIGKFFVAWDKIIAEPFNEWWSSGGQEVMLGAISKFGKSAGELTNGIVTGIFAALKGEEIDLEGSNITGIAKAGAQMAKEFVSAFMNALNLGDLAGQMPGLMKAGLFGFGAFKIGSGAFSAVKVFGQLKTAFGGVTGAAAKAAPAVASVGAKAATSAAGIGKASAVLGGLKTALAAIPVWGWVAAAAIAATAVGIKLYADAQEAHRQELLHVGDAVAENTKEFQNSAKQYHEAVSAVEGFREAKTELSVTFAPITEQDKETIRSTITELEAQQIEIEIVLANGGLSDTERMKLSAQLQTIEADKITLTFILEKLPPEQIAELEQQIAEIEAQQAEIQAKIDGGGLPPEEIAALEQQIKDLEAQKIEIQAKIKNGQITPEEISAVEQQITMLEQQQIDIQAKIDGGGLPPEEIAALEQQIKDIEISKICLSAQINPLSQEEIKVLTDALGNIEKEKIKIQARIDGGGLPPEEVSALEQQIEDLNKKEVLIKASLGGLSDQEITQYAAQQLGISYDALVPVMNSTFGLNLTVDDLQTGDYDSLIESGAIEEVNRLNTGAQLTELRGNVETAKANAPETLAEIERLEGEVAVLTQNRQATISEIEPTTKGLATLGVISAAWEADTGAYHRGEITLDEYNAKRTALEERLFNEVYSTAFVDSEVRATHTEEELRAGFEQFMGTGSDNFAATLSSMKAFIEHDRDYYPDQADAQQKEIEKKQREIETARASLGDVYTGEATLVAAEAFKDTSYWGMSVEEIATQYPQIVRDLGAEGEAMFQNMLAGLQQLNEQADYVQADQKTQPETVVDIAVKASALSDLKAQVQGIATEYQNLSAEQKAAYSASDEGVAQLEAVNAALEALGVDKIKSLDEIGTALEALGSVDLSTFSLDDVTAALTAVTGDATATKQKIDTLRASLTALDGTTATTTLTHNTYNNTYNNSYNRSYSSSIARNANGGIYDGAMLSWVAEDGPEAIIPLGAKRRNRGIDLWLQAGEMLGVAEFAEGGILAPYSGVVENVPDAVWDDDDGDGKPKPIQLTGGSISSGGNSFSISVSANPVFQIDGSSSTDDIIDKLKGKQKELAEIFGSAIAEQLEDIVANMA